MVLDMMAETVECCSWCRQPAMLCRSASCDDSPTYDGMLDMGQWVEAEGEAGERR